LELIIQTVYFLSRAAFQETGLRVFDSVCKQSAQEHRRVESSGMHLTECCRTWQIRNTWKLCYENWRKEFAYGTGVYGWTLLEMSTVHWSSTAGDVTLAGCCEHGNKHSVPIFYSHKYNVAGVGVRVGMVLGVGGFEWETCTMKWALLKHSKYPKIQTRTWASNANFATLNLCSPITRDVILTLDVREANSTFTLAA
jgi:hypothetical protein